MQTDSIMLSRLRPDMDQVAARWSRFWEAEAERPMVWWETPLRDDPEFMKQASRLTPPYPVRPDADFAKIARDLRDLVELNAECYEFVGDEVPNYAPSFGPDQFAAFLGVKMEYSDDSETTSWSVPFEKELDDIVPIALDESNAMLQAMDSFMTELARAAEGRFVVSSLDMHSNMDALAAMRGPENLCVDMLEKPDLVWLAMKQVNEAYKSLYNRFYDLARMGERGGSSWLPAYSSRRYQALASDFICLLSPEMSRKFVIPALEEELSILDHAIFHLDGPGALPHLDDILSLAKLRAIQWVPGNGEQQHGPAWFDLYKRILKAGKGLWIYCDVATARTIHAELRSNDVIYYVNGSRDEAKDLVSWLEKN